MNDKEFRMRLKLFRDLIGLGQWSPGEGSIVDNIYAIYVSPNNEVANALQNNIQLTVFDDEKAKLIKEDYESRGFHVYIAKAQAIAEGIIRKDWATNQAKFAMVYLHESFHENPHQNLGKSLEEAACQLFALEGAITFFGMCGSKKDFEEAYRLRDKQYRRIKRFHHDYAIRTEELKKRTVIDASSRKNNAFLFCEALYCLNYPLLRKVYKKIGNIFETNKAIVGLPKDDQQAIEKLETIVKS